MTDLIDTTEMYLRTIFELIEDGVVPMRARIAEQLGHSGPTVSETVARMERDGLVTLDTGDRRLELTDAGHTVAVRVMRKHRLAERLLTDVIGLDLAHAHDEACRWEHVMSERVERRLVDLLEHPDRSPYGNAIPGLDELGDAAARPDHEAVSLLDVDDGTQVTMTRIGEPAQALPGVLAALVDADLQPGAEATVRFEGEAVTLASEEGAVSLDAATARHIFVLRG